MDINIKFLLGLLTILFCIGLGYSAVNNYLIQYNTVTEALAHPDLGDIRVNGKLLDPPVIEGDSYRFQITDGNAAMQVVYQGNLPSSFTIDSDVVVIGRMGENNTFQAKTVNTKCPSKFEA